MAVRQRGAAFQADAWVKGKRTRRNFATREAAEAWLKKHGKGSAEAPTPPPRKARDDEPETLGEAADRTFERFHRGTKWERITRRKMDAVVSHFGAHLPLRSLDTAAIDDYLDSLKRRGLASSTINQRLAVISKICTFMAQRHPGAMEKPHIERERVNNTRVRWMTTDEEKRMLALFRQWGKDDHAEVIITALGTGMRPSELYAIRAGDITHPNGAGRYLLTISRTEYKGAFFPTKNNLIRSIYLTDSVAEILLRRSREAPPGAALFPYDVYWMRHAWDRARNLMGLMGDPTFIPYICRHTFASRLVQKGVSLAVIQKLLGHKNITQTMRYANIAPHNLHEAADILDAA